MSVHEVRGGLDLFQNRTVELARSSNAAQRTSGAAQGVASSSPMPVGTGGTVDNGSGYTKHAAMYDYDSYNDPNAVYMEDVTI